MKEGTYKEEYLKYIELHRRDGALAFYIELEDWLFDNGYVKDGMISVPTEIFMDFVAEELKLGRKKK